MKDISSVLEQRLNSSGIKKRRKFRAFKDIFSRYGIAVGGMGVIVAITLIFFYLLYEVVPLFKSASLETTSSFSLPGELTTSNNLTLITEEQNEQAGILTNKGQLIFFSTQDGQVKVRHQLPIGDSTITSIKEKTPSDTNLMLGLSNGEVVAVNTRFQVEYNSQGERGGIQPNVTPLFNTTPFQLDPLQRAIKQVTYQKLHDGFLVAGLVKQGEVLLSKIEQHTNFITGATVETIKPLTFPNQTNYRRLLIAPEGRYIFALTASGKLDVYNAQNLNAIRLDHSVQLVTANQKITQIIFQLGQQSLLVGDNQGQISQWFMVRNESSDQRLTHIRTLKLGDAPIAFLEAEQRRKGFVAIDTTGRATNILKPPLNICGARCGMKVMKNRSTPGNNLLPLLSLNPSSVLHLWLLVR